MAHRVQSVSMIDQNILQAIFIGGEVIQYDLRKMLSILPQFLESNYLQIDHPNTLVFVCPCIVLAGIIDPSSQNAPSEIANSIRERRLDHEQVSTLL